LQSYFGTKISGKIAAKALLLITVMGTSVRRKERCYGIQLPGY